MGQNNKGSGATLVITGITEENCLHLTDTVSAAELSGRLAYLHLLCSSSSDKDRHHSDRI